MGSIRQLVSFGTSSGSVHVSADEGESRSAAVRDLPTITSIETLITE